MALYTIKSETLTALGDAVREKTGALTREGYVDTDTWKVEVSKGLMKSYYFPAGTRSAKIEKVSYSGHVVTNVKDSNGKELKDENGKSYGDNFYLEEVTEIYVEDMDVYEFEIYHNGAWISTTFVGEFKITSYDADGNILQVPGEVKNTMTPAEMAEAIEGLPPTPPEEAFNITGDCQYRFRSNGWNWFAEQYGNRVITQDITNCAYMFYESDALSNIPFDINIKPKTTGITNLNNMFYQCNKLTNIPKINFTTPLDAASSTSSGAVNLKNMFSDCWNIKEINHDIFNNMFTEKYAEEALLRGGANFARAYMFEGCLRLREHPDLSRVMTGATGNNNFYYYMFNSCDSLDEIINLPIHPSNTTTSNMFNYSFSNCQRLKRLIFATQADDTPYTRTWKSQTIDLSSKVGWGMVVNNGLGFGLATQIKDDESYQTLKDNPDCWAYDAAYSRYNKASAIETISTLPDVSSGSGNTIKFTGAAGSKTDGGAINTMTEEEIAVATAKGWTVSFV